MIDAAIAALFFLKDFQQSCDLFRFVVNTEEMVLQVATKRFIVGNSLSKESGSFG